VLKDTAAVAAQKLIPPPTWEEFEATLTAGLAEARRLGVASVHDMYLGEWSPNRDAMDVIRLLHKVERAGGLSCRFYEAAPIERWRDLERAGIPGPFGSEFVRLGAVKAFADGSLGSGTAWFFDAYRDQPDSCGLPRLPMGEMRALIERATSAGLQIAAHAIGDRAVAAMLAIMGEVGGADAARRRFRIEHAQHLRRQDFATFAKLGVLASMQPYHAIDDGRWLESRLGPERAQTSFAWRSMLDAGARMTFGSDWPIAPLNPLLGIHAAVARQTLDGCHPEGWTPEQRITLEDALRAYTQNGAYAEFQENEKGTIAPGKLADLIVLSDDLFRIPVDRIKDVRVTLTVVGGKVVYQE
jgi:predicted amidohydrolase YtcJ